MISMNSFASFLDIYRWTNMIQLVCKNSTVKEGSPAIVPNFVKEKENLGSLNNLCSSVGLENMLNIVNNKSDLINSCMVLKDGWSRKNLGWIFLL
jgi:hypothetical protein